MSAKIAGHIWAANAGHRPVGLTLPAELHQSLAEAAAVCGGLSRAEFCRRVVSWALTQIQSESGKKRIQKICDK